LFAALQSAPCVTPDLCELRRLCVAGYSEHLRALGEIARAKSLLAAPGSETEAAQALDIATRGLRQAAPKISQCTDAEGAAQRKYKP
jgi:hypothetical protein